MESYIMISWLNDFIFCPVSIYFHQLYNDTNKVLYQNSDQINGTNSHEAIDTKKYSTRKDVLQGIEIYVEKYNLAGKIDIFDSKSGILTERKNKITQIYDGYIFQMYAEYYGLLELGYEVKKLRLYSYSDNKNYDVKLPEEDITMFKKFEKLISDMNEFRPDDYKQPNIEKCKRCIYEPSCNKSLITL